MADTDAWQTLWTAIDALESGARDLRHLSQSEPLLGARPDFPRAHYGRPRHEELRTVLDDLAKALAQARDLAPAALEGQSAVGLAADEDTAALRTRLDTLIRMTDALGKEAFSPPPPLPPHAPPYLAHAPNDLPGARAMTLAAALDAAVASLRNALLARLNAPRS